MDGAEAILDRLLPGLAPEHRTASLDAWAWIDATLAPAGIVATGSVVRGEGHPGSDFDLVVLWSRSGRQRLQRFFAGVPTEVFANSGARLRHSIRAEAARGRPVMAHMLASGVVLRDDAGVMAARVDEARQVLREGRALSDEERTRHRYLAAVAVEDALDLLPSADGDAVLVVRRAVDALLDYAFRSRGAFLPRHKQRLADLRAVDAEAAALLAAVLEADRGAQPAALRAAAQRLLGTCGFFAWDSAPETADPPLEPGAP